MKLRFVCPTRVSWCPTELLLGPNVNQNIAGRERNCKVENEFMCRRAYSQSPIGKKLLMIGGKAGFPTCRSPCMIGTFGNLISSPGVDTLLLLLACKLMIGNKYEYIFVFFRFISELN